MKRVFVRLLKWWNTGAPIACFLCLFMGVVAVALCGGVVALALKAWPNAS